MVKEIRVYEKIFSEIFTLFSSELEKRGIALPSVSQIAAENADPYRILTAAIISLRTKDKITLERSRALFERAGSFYELEKMSSGEIAAIIRPCAFYKRKAENLKTISAVIMEKYGGAVPSEMDDLISLPGVGIKSASLTLNLAFKEKAICVDCHVHQILKRIGIVETKNADATERVLRKILPERYWIPLNELLVSYGQAVCKSVSPLCSECPYSLKCRKTGVKSHR